MFWLPFSKHIAPSGNNFWFAKKPEKNEKKEEKENKSLIEPENVKISFLRCAMFGQSLEGEYSSTVSLIIYSSKTVVVLWFNWVEFLLDIRARESCSGGH
jgi:hypothetical protein